MDQSDHIIRRLDFEQQDDEAALTKAKQFIDGKAIELWSRTRLIARIDPKGES